MPNAVISSRPQLTIRGERRVDAEDLLTAAVVNLPWHGCAHGELHLTNWGRPGGTGAPTFALTDITLGCAVSLAMGQNDPTTLFRGEVTAIEERYGDGTPTMVLLVQDKLHRLGRTRHCRTFENQNPNDVVSQIAQEGGLQADVAFSSATNTWHQLNESDLAFLMRLSGRFGVGARLVGDVLRIKADDPDPNPIRLSAQDSVLKARLCADLNHQPTESHVYGYNLNAAAAVHHVAQTLVPPTNGQSAAATLQQLGWSGPEIVPQPWPRVPGEAQDYAQAHFQRVAGRFVEGELVCQGEPSLTSGREIELSGVSPSLLGKYRVVHCVHRFDNALGHETHIKLQRGSLS